MNSFGNNITITIFGSSHGAELGCAIAGLPAGARIDKRFVYGYLLRRSAAKGGLGATVRREEDIPNVTSGVDEAASAGDHWVADGGELTARFANSNTRSSDYGRIARPSHADYAAFKKYGAEYDLSGGGISSGRMTLPLVFAGAVCAYLLRERGVEIISHVLRMGDVRDKSFDPVEPALPKECDNYFPLVDPAVKAEMQLALAEAKAAGDTLSCECECAVTGLPAGLGEPFFNGVESSLSHLLFSIPGLRGVEFGERGHIRGSEMNDQFAVGGLTQTNRSGGVNGGMANGMPVVFRCWFRPVPSISLPQTGYDLDNDRPAELAITGRHDVCILPRGCAAVECAAAIALYDLMRCGNDE